MGYADYHARDWADGRTDAEIRTEIGRVNAKGPYPWNSVGCAQFDYVRVRTLIAILDTRKGLTLGSVQGEL